MATFAKAEATTRVQTGAADAMDFLGFATLFRGLRVFARAVSEHNAERQARRAMARELSFYSDRELGELGFSRADLPEIEAGTYRR